MARIVRRIVYSITGKKPPDEGVSGGFRFLYEKVFL